MQLETNKSLKSPRENAKVCIFSYFIKINIALFILKCLNAFLSWIIEGNWLESVSSVKTIFIFLLVFRNLGKEMKCDIQTLSGVKHCLLYQSKKEKARQRNKILPSSLEEKKNLFRCCFPPTLHIYSWAEICCFASSPNWKALNLSKLLKWI